MQYKYIFIPGRHHIVTQFQIDTLFGLAQDHKATIVWGITSADHGGTQRNPLSGVRRLGMIEAVAASSDLPSLVYMIGNKRPKQDFAHFVIEDIRIQTDGDVDMTPDNTLVACSTPSVIAGYELLGYAIHTMEQQTDATLPWSVVEAIIAAGSEWARDEVAKLAHPSCIAYYQRYRLAEYIQSIFADPLISSDDGDITMTRDYETYRAAFEQNAQRKVADFQSFVRPGKIIDIGCATGQTLKLLSSQPELFESDFYGIEAARPLYEICQQRKSNGEFGDSNVFFYQRNIMSSQLFADNSVSTVITMALTHEIESYLGRDQLMEFLRRAYNMLEPGGVYINYDVVGPDDGNQIVYVDLRDDDGANPSDFGYDKSGPDLARFLSSLSTKQRFYRFAHDFRREEHQTIHFREVDRAGKRLIEMRYADLCEFLAKKDYVDSWHSEMHETFCYFSHEDWCEALRSVGFEILEHSRAITNPWLIENRFRPAGKWYTEQDGELVECSQPSTNTLLIASKPE